MNIQEFINSRKQKEFRESDLISIHDLFMVEYGWIPLEEFKELPIPTLFNLIECIRKRKEAEERAMKHGRRH